MAFVAGTNLPAVDAGSHQRVFASSRGVAFVAGTKLPAVDAGGHQRVFASSSGVAFVTGTNLPTVDAGSHQKVFASSNQRTFVGRSDSFQQEIAVVPEWSAARGGQAARQGMDKSRVGVESTLPLCVSE